MLRSVVVVLSLASAVYALDNGLALTPQMGWNSWNKFGCNIDQDLIKGSIDALADSPLRKAGYDYINMDDCWMQLGRDKDGNLVPDPKTFPDGIKPLADYAHSKGIKFGLYSSAGLKTCAGREASLGHEEADAKLWASWGIDYLKYDNCGVPDKSTPEVRYPPMRDALAKSGRSILFSMCEWGVDKPWEWAAKVGNSWRTTGDISANWKSVMSNMDQQVGIGHYAGPGAWNDPDMLECGNGDLTITESKSHFFLWSVMKSPLLIGNDIRGMPQDLMDILTAPEVIAVSQDKKGVAGDLVDRHDNIDVWATINEDGSRAAVLLNRADNTQDITIDFTKLGFAATDSLVVRDIWLRKDMGTFTGSYTAKAVASHDSVFIRVAPSSASTHVNHDWRPVVPMEPALQASFLRAKSRAANDTPTMI